MEGDREGHLQVMLAVTVVEAMWLDDCAHRADSGRSLHTQSAPAARHSVPPHQDVGGYSRATNPRHCWGRS